MEGVTWALTSTYASNWHPITWLSHMLDVECYGMNAGGHHFTNVFFHIINSLLLFIIFTRMTGHVWQSFVVAFLFAIHPLHVESVAWVAERKDVLSTFFALLTLWSYVQYVQYLKFIQYFSVIIFFIFSLMSKPMAVTLPFVLLLIDFWPLKRIQIMQSEYSVEKSSTALPVRQLLYEKIPLFALSSALCVVTFLAQQQGKALGTSEEYPLTMRISNALVSYIKYITKMIWPYDLGILYPYPRIVTAWQIAGAVMVLGGITFLSVRYFKRLPWFFVGWFWYIGTLVPVIGIVQAGVQSMADRYSYIPMTGIFIILSWGIAEFFRNCPYKKILLPAIAIASFFVLSIASWIQVTYWKNSICLFEHTLKVTEGNYVIHNNLGFELALQGQNDKALKHYKEALRINSNFEQAHINYASLQFSLGRITESFYYYKKLLKYKPNFAVVHYSFAVLLLKAGNIDTAVSHFIEALRIKPDFAEAYNGLGAIMVSRGKIAEAAAFFKKALQIEPGLADAKENLKKLSDYNQTQAKQKK